MRKEEDFTITAPGRDTGKVFHLKEMPALQAEKWATRALMLVAASGVDIGTVRATDGMRGLAILGLQALMRGIPWALAEPLLDELLICVQIKPSSGIVRPLTVDDIDEVPTYLQLRMEVLRLHVDFSQADALLRQVSGTSA